MKYIYNFNKEYCSIVHIFETIKSNDKKKQKNCEIQLVFENVHRCPTLSRRKNQIIKISSLSMFLLSDLTNTFNTEG